MNFSTMKSIKKPAIKAGHFVFYNLPLASTHLNWC